MADQQRHTQHTHTNIAKLREKHDRVVLRIASLLDVEPDDVKARYKSSKFNDCLTDVSNNKIKKIEAYMQELFAIDRRVKRLTSELAHYKQDHHNEAVLLGNGRVLRIKKQRNTISPTQKATIEVNQVNEVNESKDEVPESWEELI